MVLAVEVPIARKLAERSEEKKFVEVAEVPVAFIKFRPWREVSCVVEVATKFCATTCPAMESFAYGDEVPIPTLPLALIRKSEEDAVPSALVEVETSKSESCEP